MVFATWRKVFIRDTRKVNARNTGAVNVLGAFAENFALLQHLSSDNIFIPIAARFEM